MKTKHMMNGGLAFTEKKDLKKLEKYASEGWVFNKFVFGGLFYQMVEGPKQELNYTLDIQSNPDKEYFELFNTSGWQYVSSAANHFHIFSAPKGTAPIYSGNEIDEGKYSEFTYKSGKIAIFSFIGLAICIIASSLGKIYFPGLRIPLLVITMIFSTVFVFSFMPYVAYKYKEKTNK